MRAKFPSVCWRCDGPIAKDDTVVIRKGKVIHPGCAPGGDDERMDGDR